MSTDSEFESAPGIPGALPEGEQVLWQGRPNFRALARQQLKVRWLAAYFAVFLGFKAVAVARGGDLQGGLSALALAASCLTFVYVFAFFASKATVYTITSKRVLLRIGLALPLNVNLPFRRIASADLARRSAKDGDVVLTLSEHLGLKWLYLWPHVALLPMKNPKPTLCGLSEPEKVAEVLGNAVRAWAQSEGAAVSSPKRPSTDTRAPAGPTPLAAAVH